MKPKRVDQPEQRAYNNEKQTLGFNDLSGLPAELLERMNPVREHIRTFAIDTINDAIKFVNGEPLDQAIVLSRLQKLKRLLSHLEGESDENVHNITTSQANAAGTVVGSPFEIRRVDSGRPGQHVLARSQHEQLRKSAVHGNRVTRRR